MQVKTRVVTNKLAGEKSPYLQQHANNPVDWMPWSEEAFQLAKRENKPIFLSIGYSTCHWCHVMERESFENNEIADYLNAHFVSIKVDREELPEVDSLYMNAVQILTGRGGWPMSVWLDHNLQPFYGGTYFPPKNFFVLLNKINEFWKTKPEELKKATTELRKILDFREETAACNFEELRATFFSTSANAFDGKRGGHQGAPKFPMNYEIVGALRLAKSGDQKEQALQQAEMTLTNMLSSGIWDHVGGGIHRYSTDDEWRVPHFEKMLYDQASLLLAITEILRVKPNAFFEKRAEELLTYIQHRLTDERGGFFSAEDADSEGHEGTFYVWSYEELRKILSPSEIENLATHFEISPEGNWEGKVVFHQKNVGDAIDLPKILFDTREKRPRPFRDEKIITAWNGLMIAGLSRYARLGSERALRLAERCANFVRENLFKNGKLMRRWIQGEAKFHGQLEDYAFMIEGLIELSLTTANLNYLNFAEELQMAVTRDFWDKQMGAFVCNAGEHVWRKNQDWADNVTPSPLATNLLNLIWLQEYAMKDFAGTTLPSSLPTAVASYTVTFPRLLEAIHLHQNHEFIVAICDSTVKRTEYMQRFEKDYQPQRKILLDSVNKHPIFAGKELKYKPVTYYICRNKICEPPREKLD